MLLTRTGTLYVKYKYFQEIFFCEACAEVNPVLNPARKSKSRLGESHPIGISFSTTAFLSCRIKESYNNLIFVSYYPQNSENKLNRSPLTDTWKDKIEKGRML